MYRMRERTKRLEALARVAPTLAGEEWTPAQRRALVADPIARELQAKRERIWRDACAGYIGTLRASDGQAYPEAVLRHLSNDELRVLHEVTTALMARLDELLRRTKR
jgi:hypothetical protein